MESCSEAAGSEAGRARRSERRKGWCSLRGPRGEMAIARRMNSLTRGCTGDMCSLFALARAGPEVSGLLLPRDPERPQAAPAPGARCLQPAAVAWGCPTISGISQKGEGCHHPHGVQLLANKEVTGPPRLRSFCRAEGPGLVIETTWAGGLQGCRERGQRQRETAKTPPDPPGPRLCSLFQLPSPLASKIRSSKDPGLAVSPQKEHYHSCFTSLVPPTPLLNLV